MKLIAYLLILGALARPAEVLAEDNPFIGRWALTLADGRAGWLGVEEKEGALSASLLWGSGSVLPADQVTLDGTTLIVSRDVPLKVPGTRQTLMASCHGDSLDLTSVMTSPDGKSTKPDALHGVRIAVLPPRPDLAKVQFGPAINLLTDTLDVLWRPVDPKAPYGWTLKDGVLSNRVTKLKKGRYANLRTNAVYEDFMVTAEVRTLPESNSGIFLRGIYEIQIAETYGKTPDSHNMGALYSRITPRVAAERPVGEWQTIKIILVARHVSVWLNNVLIIDNQPALGCTGGALTSNEFLPGPIMLQGDHSDIDFRNIQVSPVLK